MAGIDLSGIIGNQQASLVNAQTQVASDYSQIQDLSNQVVQATQAAGSDDQVIQTQQAQGLLQAQTAARQVASSYGGNPDDVSFIMNQLGQQWQQTEQKQLDAEKVIQQKQSVSFLDDPLQWLSNKLTVNTDINNYNNLEAQSNQLYDQLNKINDLNTKTAESMKAIAQTQTAATVAATSDLAAQKATAAAATARIQGILYNVKGVQDVTTMGQDQVDNAVKGAQTAIAEGHLAVAQQQLVIEGKEWAMKADLYAQDIKDKQAADAADATVADQTNRGRAAMGLPPLPSAKIFSLFKMGGEAGEALKQQYTAGALTDVTGKPMIAPTTGTAARMLATSQSPIATTNPALAPVTNVLAKAYADARNPANMQMAGVKNNQDMDVLTSNLVGQQVNAMAGNIKTGDNTNMFSAPPLTSLASLQSVKDNPLYQKVLMPAVKTGMSETDPQKILQLAASAVQQGQISLQDAVKGYSSLFNSAVQLNNSTRDYTRFGIAPQHTYNTTMGTGIFGGQVAIDLTNPAQVSTAFMKYMTSTEFAEAKAGFDAKKNIFENLYGGGQ
jgi:hypothetical protein